MRARSVYTKEFWLAGAQNDAGYCIGVTPVFKRGKDFNWPE